MEPKLLPIANPREEGELSSGDEQEDQVCSVSECNSADGSIPISPENKCSQEFHAGNVIPDHNRASFEDTDGQSRAHVQPVAQKTVDKNWKQLKTNTLGFSASAGMSDNLVINFSDEESDSDIEESAPAKAAENKTNIPVVVGKRKPPAPLPSKSNKQITLTASKVTPPQRPSVTRPIVSSFTKTFGAQVKSSKAINKSMPSHKHEYVRGVNTNNNKLQDLRQQIALRESEIKLKSAQRNKEPGSLRDDNTSSFLSDPARKAKREHIESNGPEKKRKKVDGSFPAQPNLVGSQEIQVGKSVPPFKEPALHNNDSPAAVPLDYTSKGSSAYETETSIFKWNEQTRKHTPGVLSESNSADDNAITNCIQATQNHKQVEFSPILNQATSPANLNLPVTGKNLNNVELNPSKIQQTCSSLNKALSGKDIIMRDNNVDFLSTLSDKYQDSPSNEGVQNYPGNPNVSTHRNVNMQSLVAMEESLDKDLEDAQDHRRMCEVQERSALKAYRKAQRDLIEANARCTDLYRKRELYSAHLRSLMISDSALLCSSSQNDKVGIGFLNEASGDMLQIIPSNRQLQPEYDCSNPLVIDSNFQYLNSVPVQTSFRQVNGRTPGSEPCSEPDASTSEPLFHGDKAPADGFLSPSNYRNVAADEDDETLSIERFVNSREKKIDDEKTNLNEERSRKLATDSLSDSLLLEATLRSKLVARMGVKNSKDSGSSDDTFVQTTENAGSNGQSQAILESFPSFHIEPTGLDSADKSESEAIGETQHDCLVGSVCLNPHFLLDYGINGFLEKEEGHRMSISEILEVNIIRSAFSRLKIISTKILMEWQSRNRQYRNNEVYDKLGASILFGKIECENLIEAHETKGGSYTVDPLWPLCLYELRGKCNNEECPWQHSRDSESDVKAPKHFDVMVSPAYLVGSNILDVGYSLSESVLNLCWQKCFSLSLTLSNAFQKDYPGGWNGHSSYFRSSSERLNQFKQSMADDEQVLEVAILIVNQETDKHSAMKKALPFLSRSLEVDPTSISLWIFYLLIYHSNTTSVAMDDMFAYAVKYNEGSYELWLMYIKSRLHFNDHLTTYEAALRSLCRTASSASDSDHASSCILDLFLQMIDCLCMSGNAENAIHKIVELSSRNLQSPPLLLSDVNSCLNTSDKHIFWVCCVYLVIYRKLPDDIVEQFECEKQLPEIEWSPMLLQDEERRRAVEVMETGAASVASLMKSDSDTRVEHIFAVNHIRCMAALDGLESCAGLLDKYLQLYPSCAELVLISIRSFEKRGSSVSGFEDMLDNWAKERPGIHCIWNQYAESALQNGQNEAVKELMDRWFQSAWQAHNLENGETSNCCLESAPNSIGESRSTLDQIDQVFGFLNFSLYKVLQNDGVGACIGFNKALKAAGPKYLKHCIREHATFWLTDESLAKENASVSGILNLLKQCSSDSPVLPLPRKFINGIKKPRARQLMSNVFSPLSADCSLVNLVLEAWFGPSLIPDESNEPKHLVDFVEDILDKWPSNYKLALSVCRKLSNGKNTTISMLFWGCSNLVDAICQAVPIPPENIWVEAAGIFEKVTGVDGISLRLHSKALTAYSFSVKLWKSYQTLHVKMGGDAKTIEEEAKAKGVNFL